MLHVFQRVKYIRETETGFYSFSNNDQSSVLKRSYIEMRPLHISKNGFMGTSAHSYKIYTIITFLRKVFFKWVVSTLSYLVVCFRNIKYGSCNAKMWDALISRKRSVQAAVLLSL